MRRAEIAQAGVGLGSDVLGKRRSQPRLADAWLAGQQHDPPLAALRLLPAAEQQLDFLVTPDERRLSRAQCLEAAGRRALTDDPPGVLRLGKAGERLRPEIGEFEQPADLPARGSAMTIVFGSASPCTRAARFGVSPTTPRSCDAPAPIRSPTTASPVATPIRTRKVARPVMRATASITAIPARTACSASSSWAWG